MDDQYADRKALADRNFIVERLYSNETLKKNRLLVHASHVCDLYIDSKISVIDVRELIEGAMISRGVNRMVFLDERHNVIHDMEYFNSRPLFCRGNKLYIYGDIRVDELDKAGNVLTFDSFGYVVDIQSLDPNDWH